MDVRRLRHFVAVAETLHFGRAAELLHMTQPPLSQSIRALERELGTALFVRTKRSVALTPFAAQWLDPVRAALAAIDALPDTAERIRRGETGRLNLAFVSTADYSLLPDLVQRFRMLYPKVDLALTEATSDIQIAALLRCEVQAGIMIPPANAALPEELVYRRLMSEPLIAAVPEQWLDSGRLELTDGRLSPEAVVASPLVVFPRHVAPSFHDLVTTYYLDSGGPADIAQQAIQMQTIISLVSAGLGIALVPESLRHLARTGTCYVPLQRRPPYLDTGIVWRRDDTSPLLANLLEILPGDDAAR
ncbi:LysR family transcriptional regulator [Salinisphaera hydrothermalis]|uniref:LysR family transcriptional regulator n=1 Tax=Salinisphaera hydrothermalis (strain C41B8) TaxID=1304275 RepID=A0A084IJ33_SALHC|nr:LysR family transcriptional regulator [Salinisphaera hydrothermalis]KEZ76717.1 LysR family transcriptional regulator [Salinisphaera hydrothermalis C41B8]